MLSFFEPPIGARTGGFLLSMTCMSIVLASPRLSTPFMAMAAFAHLRLRQRAQRAPQAREEKKTTTRTRVERELMKSNMSLVRPTWSVKGTETTCSAVSTSTCLMAAFYSSMFYLRVFLASAMSLCKEDWLSKRSVSTPSSSPMLSSSHSSFSDSSVLAWLSLLISSLILPSVVTFSGNFSYQSSRRPQDFYAVISLKKSISNLTTCVFSK